jgi:Ca2+-binding RTX toxin-like protein
MSTGLNLTGTDGPDELYGSVGDDRLDGGDGDDALHGGEGNDELLGGRGNDRLYDGFGNDILRGGEGDDLLEASGPGRSLLFGDAGNDRLLASRGNSVLDGGAGHDALIISTLSDIDGPQTIEARGGDGLDYFYIELNHLRITATLSGGSGVDTYVLSGLPQAAVASVTDFVAGAGGDIIDITAAAVATTGNPFAAGGSARLVQRGADTMLQLRTNPDSPDFQDALLLRNLSAGTLVSQNFSAGFNPDGSSTGQSIGGSGGADLINGTWLDDRIDGGAGNDTLHGFVGNDQLLGGEGDDELDGDSYGGQYPLSYPWDIRFSGDDRLEGGAGNDTLYSSWGSDVLIGGVGDDWLRLVSDSRRFTPTLQHVTLDGGDGKDHIEISSTLMQPLAATITGGAGIDLFELSIAPSSGVWTIEDFQAGVGGDMLDLAGRFGFSLQSPFATGILRLEQRGADTVIRMDSDAGGSRYTMADLVTLKNVVKETIVAANIRYGYAPDGTPLVIAPEVRGSAGGERMEGDARSNIFRAEEGNDILAGRGGNDMLVGGDGLDTALYGGKRAEYSLRDLRTLGEGPLWVSDLRAGVHDGMDEAWEIERFVFADSALALDTGLKDVAGQAYRIYRAAFDRAPDEAGLGFWIAGMDRGATLLQVAEGFVRSREFSALYGTAPTNAEVVTRLYQNILHREPDGAGYDYWLDALDRKIVDLPTVLTQFSQSGENVSALAELIAGGVIYQPYGA